MKRRIAVLVLPVLLLGGGVAALATSNSTPSYHVIDFGVGYGDDINDDGLVAGWATGTDGTPHAVVWDSATGQKTDLGIADSAATGISASGVVVGYAVSGGVRQAFRWQNGVRTDLGTLAGDTESSATDINDSGQISGWSSGGSSGTRAFVWTDGTMTDLGNLGGSSTIPTAINDAGEVVGNARPTGDPEPHQFPVTHAFHWDAASGIGDLDDGTGDLGSQAFGINAAGDMVGASWFWSTGGYYDASAALWRNGTQTLLFGSGVRGIFAFAVNDATDSHGVQIVGTATHDGAGPYVTMWELDDAGGVTVTNLDDQVDPASIPYGLLYPTAINARGQIVCHGWVDGRVRVFTPGAPPPSPPPTPSKPPAPTNISAQAGSEIVTLYWSSVSTADGYTVKRATASGGPYATIASVLTPGGSYTDATAPLGGTSFYVVTASNAAGESAPSPVAAAVPRPFAPTNLNATAGKGNHKSRIELRWTASKSQNVAQYRVYRRDSAGDVLLATVEPSTNFTVTGLARRTTYGFYVTAVHSGGQESVASNVVSVTTH